MPAGMGPGAPESARPSLKRLLTGWPGLATILRWAAAVARHERRAKPFCQHRLRMTARNAIRLAMTAFTGIVLALSAVGIRWTSQHQPPSAALASGLVLAVSSAFA